MKENYSAIILAAGSSGRMGQPKALLPFDRQRCFARKLADEFYAFGCCRVAMVTNSDVVELVGSCKYNLNGMDIILNPTPSLGRFYSLYLALQAIDTQYIFMANADNPFVTAGLLSKLWENARQADYVCPAYKGKGGHPILISPDIVSAVKAQTSFQINLKDFLNRFRRIYVDVDDEQVLVNINTPDDYSRLIGTEKKLNPVQSKDMNYDF